MLRSRNTLIAALLLFLGAGLAFVPTKAFFQWREAKLRSEYVSKFKTQDSEIGVQRHRTQTLERVLKDAEKNNIELMETIAELKSRPEKIRTVIQTVTKIEGQVEYVDVLPDSHVFRTEEGIAVASIETTDQVALITHSLEFKSIYVLAENYTSYRLSVNSSYEPEVWYELSQDLEVIDMRSKKHKFFFPNVGMGVSLNIPTFEPGFALFFSFMHPTPSIDILSVRAQIFKTPRLGIDAIGYRVSDHIPFFSDIWIYAGASVSLEGNVTGDLTMATRL